MTCLLYFIIFGLDPCMADNNIFFSIRVVERFVQCVIPAFLNNQPVGKFFGIDQINAQTFSCFLTDECHAAQLAVDLLSSFFWQSCVHVFVGWWTRDRNKTRRTEKDYTEDSLHLLCKKLRQQFFRVHTYPFHFEHDESSNEFFIAPFLSSKHYCQTLG